MKDVTWNLWHGCHKKSEGCQNCYVYRMDKKRDIDSSVVTKTKNFDLPIRKKRKGEYKYPTGTSFALCFTSDFFLKEADEWRKEAWNMIKERSDCTFLFITKRIERFFDVIPEDWGDGYENVSIGCTCENQKRADERLPFFLKCPIKHRIIICEPLLGPIDLSSYLKGIDEVVAGGESGNFVRPCDYEWILKIRNSCIANGVTFWFKQTGALFIKNGKTYRIKRQDQHSQARKANINYQK